MQILLWTPQNINNNERRLFEQLIELEDERIRSGGELLIVFVKHLVEFRWLKVFLSLGVEIEIEFRW